MSHSSTQDEKSAAATDNEPMKDVVLSTEFTSSDLWRNHLCRSNFASYQEIVSTEEGSRMTRASSHAYKYCHGYQAP